VPFMLNVQHRSDFLGLKVYFLLLTIFPRSQLLCFKNVLHRISIMSFRTLCCAYSSIFSLKIIDNILNRNSTDNLLKNFCEMINVLFCENLLSTFIDLSGCKSSLFLSLYLIDVYQYVYEWCDKSILKMFLTSQC
jgi:hypothetical protein